MKHLYFLVLGILFGSEALCQTTVATTLTPSGSLGGGGSHGIQFWVKNNNSYTIRLFRINAMNSVTRNPQNHTYTVSFKNTANNSAPGNINAGNGWTSAGTFVHNQCFNTLYPVLSNLAIDIPAGATYRIWITNTDATNNVRSSIFFPSVGVTTSSNGGVDLMTGDSVGWWGSPTASGASNPFIDFIGSIEFYQLVSCTGTPEVGNIIGSSGSCNGDTKFYYLDGYIPANNITYQWQISTTSPTTGYTNVAGNNTTMLARTHGATNEFIRCIATCGSLRDTTPVFRDTLNPFYLCYCNPNASTNTTNWGSIETVEVSTTNTSNTTGTCETYTDYRTLPIPKVRAGELLKVRIKNKSCSPNSNSAATCWIDLNRSGAFDAAEAITGGFVFGGSGSVATVEKTLQIPLTNPLGITGMRMSLDALGGTPPTTPCSASFWGEVEEYLVDIIRDSNDIKMDSITGLADGCDLGNTNINFKATNIGHKTMNPVTVSYSVNGGTPVTENFASLAPGATAAYTFSAQANLAGNGTKVIRVWHQNTLDTNKRNDTQVMTIISHPTPPNLTPIDDTVCVGSDFTTFTAASNPPFMTRWYTDAGALNEIATGNSIVVNNPTASSIRYAKSVYTFNGKVGPTALTPSITDFSSVGQGLLFNVLRNRVRINSVKARFTQAGVAAIEIRSPSNAVLQTTSFLILTANTDVVVPLNIDLPIGTGYRMLMNSTSGQPFSINGFSSFPQMIPGVISITGNTNTFTPPRYNYFFDWDVTYDACSSPVVPVNSVYLGSVNAPLKTLYKDTFFCQFPTVFLDANNAGSSYKWHDGSTGRTIQVTNSGVYKVTITSPEGCKSTDSSKVQVRTSPIFNIGNDTTICSGKKVKLKSGFSNEGFNHTWSTGSLDPSIEVQAPGQYTVDVFNTNTSCGYKDTIIVSTVQSPNAFLGRDTFACNSAPITIKAPNPGSYAYLWDNGTSLPTRTVSQNGVNKIFVEVTDISNPYGCKSSDTLIAALSSLTKPNLGSDVTTCTNPYTLGIAADPLLEYRWSNGGTTNNIKVTESNDYVLTVTQVNTTCSYMDTVKVTINSNPPLDLGDDIVTCKNDPITITANTGWTTYAWSNGFNVNKITVIPTPGTNTYTLTVTGPCGNKTVSKNIIYTADVPDVDLPSDMVVCEPTTLSITNPGSGIDVLWSTTETGLSITADKTGTYWVKVSNACGSKSDAVRVTFDTIPTPEFIANWSGNFASFSNKSTNAVSYYWEFGDDSTSTDKHPTHIYKDRKQYTVKLTVKNSCDSSVTITKSIDLSKKPVGIQVAQLDGITVFPNPTTDVFTVKYTQANQQNYTLELLSMDGRIVKNVSDKFDLNSEIKLDVSDLATGSYILRLSDVKGNQELKKLSIIK
ncbi:MAG: T9SS type A sorting domain-containing protein [Chitinophagales bacterium]|nr:T9SS type A sorting domain-containing protein [Chitinophagales bacterium]